MGWLKSCLQRIAYTKSDAGWDCNPQPHKEKGTFQKEKAKEFTLMYSMTMTIEMGLLSVLKKKAV